MSFVGFTVDFCVFGFGCLWVAVVVAVLFEVSGSWLWL